MLTTTRAATVADVIRRLQGSTYQRTMVTALGWGMGPAQDNIGAAVDRAAKAGLLTVHPRDCGDSVSLTEYGKDWEPRPMFTLTYRTSNGPCERVLPAAGVERVGRVVMRLADRDMATDIEVLNETGADVTFDFACFC